MMKMSDDPIDLATARPRKQPACPICSRPVVAAFKPFCSKRCADVDLSRWLGEAYRVPVAPDDDEAEQADEKNRTL